MEYPPTSGIGPDTRLDGNLLHDEAGNTIGARIWVAGSHPTEDYHVDQALIFIDSASMRRLAEELVRVAGELDRDLA